MGLNASKPVFRVTMKRVGTGVSGDLWDTHGKDDGRPLVKRSRLPVFDTARTLHSQRVTGVLEVWHVGAIFAALRVDIERGAKLTVIENRKLGPRFGTYQPFNCTDEMQRPIAVSASSQEQEVVLYPPNGCPS